MPLNNENIEKLYYSIGEVADMFEVNTSLIRYWEKEFDIIKPKKNNKGNRLFTKKDVDNLRQIYTLVKERGMTLRGAKQELDNMRKNQSNSREQVIIKLKKIRQNLLDLQNELP